VSARPAPPARANVRTIPEQRPAAPPPAASTESAELAAKIDPLFATFAGSTSPGCAVGVYRAGETIFAKGYGLASLEHGAPIGSSTTFELASMSKQFTATAVLLLAQDGKLSLDDDIRKYVPELPSYGRTITLRHLLHHTGGLREYDALLDLSGYDVADVATADDALHLVTLQKGVNFPAGTEWSYSNTGYFLLSFVVKRVSGKTLGAFSEERIFGPLGMKHTTLFDDHTKIIPHRATAYAPRGAGFEVAMSNREQTGEGNVQSTIEDLARWDASFYEPRTFGRSWLDAMRTPGKLDDGTALTYAMGLIVKTNNGLAEEEHSGGWAGYRTHMRRYPTERLSIACLCNRADADPTGLTMAVARALHPKLAAPKGPSPSPPSSATGAAATPSFDVTPFAGAYIEPSSLTVRTVAVKDGVVELGFALTPGEGPPPRALERIDARSFRVSGAASRWTLEPPAGKAPQRLVRTAPGEKTHTYQRFEPSTLDAAKLAPYAGRYTSAETTHDFTVAVVDGKLVAGPLGKPRQATTFKPLGPDTFLATGFGLVFGRDAKGAVADVVAVFDGHRAVRWTKR